MRFYEWLCRKYCKGCNIQTPCEKCFVNDWERWLSLVKQWEKETR